MISPPRMTHSSLPRSSVVTHPATLQRRVARTLFLLIAALLSSAPMAADRLTGKEIKQLLKGSEVWATKEGVSVGSSSIALAQHGTNSIRYRFFADGRSERSASGYNFSHDSKGKWWVKKRKLCMEFDDNRKSCSKLEQLPDGRYRLYGKDGKPRKVVFDKIAPL